MATARPARIAVTGDEPLLARGLAALLDAAPDLSATCVEWLSVVAGGPVGADAVVWVGDHLDRATLEALREARRRRRTLSLCLIVCRADAAALERLVVETRVRFAVLLRTAPLDPDQCVALVRQALRGRAVVDAALLRRAAAEAGKRDRLRLTQTEFDVLKLMAGGLRNAEIGRRLWKSEKTIEKVVGRVFVKLGLFPDKTPHLDRRVVATRMYLAGQIEEGAGLIPDAGAERPRPVVVVDAAQRQPEPRLTPEADDGVLTVRELEVVALIAEGLTNQEIGRRLHIELATVKNHVHNVFAKLGIRRRAQAAAWYRRNGSAD